MDETRSAAATSPPASSASATRCGGRPARGRLPSTICCSIWSGSGFAGAPRALGIDAQGREMLYFAEGAAAWPWEAFRPLATDAGLSRVAALIGDYHAAVADYRPPPDAAWSPIAPPAASPTRSATTTSRPGT